MFTTREAATLLAGLQYWREEMAPHGRAIMRPYFREWKLERIAPLNRGEIAKLFDRLQAIVGDRPA